MSLRIFILLMISFVASGKAYAETANETPFWNPPSPDQLKTKLGISFPKYTFEVNSPSTSKVAKFEPNADSKAYVTLSYRNLSVTTSFANPQPATDNGDKGTSSGNDFQLRFYGKKTLELFYQSYKGYYLDNSADLDPSYQNTSRKILYPNLETKNYGLTFFWNLNDEEFSHAAAFDQNGHQLKPAWGWSWFAHASHSKISNGSNSFIPASATANFGSLGAISEVDRLTLAGGFAVGGISVWGKRYASGLLAFGPGYQSADLKGTDGTTDLKNDVSPYASVRISAGYNGDHHVFGVQLIGESVGTKTSDGEISGSLTEGGFFYAYRFDDVQLPLLDGLSAWVD